MYLRFRVILRGFEEVDALVLIPMAVAVWLPWIKTCNIEKTDCTERKMALV